MQIKAWSGDRLSSTITILFYFKFINFDWYGAIDPDLFCVFSHVLSQNRTFNTFLFVDFSNWRLVANQKVWVRKGAKLSKHWRKFWRTIKNLTFTLQKFLILEVAKTINFSLDSVIITFFLYFGISKVLSFKLTQFQWSEWTKRNK